METDQNGVSVTPVLVSGPRGGPLAHTLRRDRWWAKPAATAAALLSFAIYSTWSAFANFDYYAGPRVGRDYLSPFYSPCISSNCAFKFGPVVGSWWHLSPALLVLIFPLGFRSTCYYYRRSYYRSFFWAPPACAVPDAPKHYTGESRFPLLAQNLHRYFLYFALAFNVVLTFDAVEAFRFPGGFGVGLGSLVLTLDAVVLWLYSISCHSCRHLCGGRLKLFSEHPWRHAIWKRLSVLNKYHNRFAWARLFWVAVTDFYVRLVASGAIHDPRFF